MCLLRLDSLALRLAIPLPTVVQLIGRQPLIWVIQPSTVAVTVQQVADRLGMEYRTALELVTRMPVVLMLEARLLQFSLQGAQALAGAATQAYHGRGQTTHTHSALSSPNSTRCCACPWPWPCLCARWAGSHRTSSTAPSALSLCSALSSAPLCVLPPGCAACRGRPVRHQRPEHDAGA